MPVKPLRQKAKQLTLLVRARLSHQWKEDEPGPMVAAVHRQHEVPSQKGGGSVLHGVRARVGMIFDRNLAEPGLSEGGWRPTVEPEEVPHRAEYLQALAHGDLWPANQETVDLLNGYDRNQGLPAIKFDPTYGGELKVLKDWLDEIESDRLDKVGNAKVPAKAEAPVKTEPTSTPTVHATDAEPSAETSHDHEHKPEGEV